MRPADGSQIPEMGLIRGDFPAPLSPPSAVTWPAGISKSTPVSAMTAPKFLPMPRTRSPSISAAWSPAPDGARPAAANPAPLSQLPVTGRVPGCSCLFICQPEMPAAAHSAEYLPLHSCEAGTNLSAITVLFMLEVVTHVGVS